MDVKKLVMAVVGMVLAAVMIGGALLPTVASVTAESDTYINGGYYEMKKYTTNDTLTATWDYSNPDVLVVNEESVTVPYPDLDRDYSIVLSTNSNVRMSISHNSLSFYGSGTYVNASSTNPTFSLTYSEGTITATNGDVTKSISDVTEVMCIANTGDYVMKKATDSVYLKGDSEIFANGLTYFGSQVLQFSIWGTFDNPVYTEVSGNFSASDFTKVYTESRNHVDLYELEKFTFVGSYDGNSKDITYDVFVVPKEVTADRTNPMDSTLASLFDVLPLVTIAGLVMAGIYVFISRK